MRVQYITRDAEMPQKIGNPRLPCDFKRMLLRAPIWCYRLGMGADRYYERVGLVQPTQRAENNYRVYTEDTLQVIAFIHSAQAAGFTLDDIRALLLLHTGDAAICKDVQPLIEKRVGMCPSASRQCATSSSFSNRFSPRAMNKTRMPPATSSINSTAVS